MGENISTIIVAIIVGIIAVFAVIGMKKNKNCGCGCEHCSTYNICNKNKKK